MRPICARFLPVFIAALVLPLTAAAAQATIEGTIRYDATSVPITHVYARETRPHPTGDPPPEVVILIADRPAPAEVAASRQAYYAAAGESRIRGLLIALKPPPDQARLVIFAPGGGSADVLLPDPFSRVELTDLIREAGWVSGRLRSIEPGEFVGGGGGPDEPASYAVDVRFRAAIAPAPRPSEDLTGDAARRSEPAAAALRTFQLARTAGAAELRARLHPQNPAWAPLGTELAEEVLAAARENFPSPATFLQSIQRVLVYGDEALIVTRASQGPLTLSLRRDDGEWKLAALPIPND